MNAAPRATARRAGVLYLISGVPAGFSVWVVLKLVVRGDPAATATNVLASESLFRLGTVADLVGILLFVGSLAMLYELFRPVGRSLTLLMAWFGVIGSTIQALSSLGNMTALLLLKGGPTMAALPVAQAHALAYQFLRLHTLLYDLALVFFGAFALVIGQLILRSSFLPRVLGVLMTIDGLGYLTFSGSTFLAPPFAAHLYPYLPFATAVLGEALLMLWLIVKAVDDSKWHAQAAATRAGRPTAAA